MSASYANRDPGALRDTFSLCNIDDTFGSRTSMEKRELDSHEQASRERYYIKLCVI